jgi:hypothetical protein
MYAGDNNSKLPLDGDQNNPGNGPLSQLPNSPTMQPRGVNYVWGAGNMDAYDPYATNDLQASSLFPYVRTISVFHCPADTSGHKVGPFFFPNERSYSMNCYLAPIDPWQSVGSHGTRDFFKDTDINNPKPSMTYVFIGENSYSINDSYFVSDPTQAYDYFRIFPKRVMVVRAVCHMPTGTRK